MKFKVTEYISKYMRVEDEWKNIEVEKYYYPNTWDDLQNLLGTLIDYADDSIKFEVKKIEEEANG